MTGDPNAAVDTAQPLVLGPQFGGHGAAPAEVSVAFVARAALEAGADRLPTRRRRVAVSATRGIGAADMVRNRRTGKVDVEASSGAVSFDGDPVWSEPLDRVSLGRLYFL